MPKGLTYYTVFKYGVADTICSKHRKFGAAVQAALKCERMGGAKHEIWVVSKHGIAEQRRRARVKP